MKTFLIILVMITLTSLSLAGCSRVEIPEYPGAVEDEQHEAKFLGMSFAKVRRVYTDDSYDQVFAFYEDALGAHEPEIVTHTLDDGRQTAITVEESRKSSVMVAIQEFKKDGKVAIVYMNMGL